MTDTRRSASILITLICLGGLLLALPWWLSSSAPALGMGGAIVGGVAVPAILLLTVSKRLRNWSGITALCMIPFTVIGVMDVVANLDNPGQGLIIALLAIAAFFAVLDAGRREG